VKTCVGIALAALLAAFVTCACMPGEARADGCGRGRVVSTGYGYAAPVYHAPTYYGHDCHDTKVIAVEVQRDRYYSLSDLYLQKLQLDLLGELMEWKKANGGGYVPPAPAAPAAVTAPQPAAKAATAAVQQAVAQPAGKGRVPRQQAYGSVATLLKAECVKCHKAGGARLDLTDVAKVPAAKWWEVYGRLNSGNMPPDPAEPVADADVDLVRQQAERGS
jgi:hypothetical protein